ncbi:MAG: asparagine synthase B [Endozoicomonadaceae bacterium]|nr:asparagine synthase B [Endozoicomonadaceae bacterium]
MCSVFSIFNIKNSVPALRTQGIRLSAKLRHRGPDWSGVYENDHTLMIHERLSIVGVENGAQPLYSIDPDHADKRHVLAVNGEIYNHQQLEASLKTPHSFTTRSDCEVILALYKEEGTAFLNKLHGMFAFTLYDEAKDRYFIARDPIGIIPLYIGHDAHGQFYVASEMKALTDVCDTVEIFPPGHYLISHDDKGQPCGKIQRYYKRDWKSYTPLFTTPQKPPAITTENEAVDAINTSLTDAVKSHLMTDVPYAVLLSGGLDSSIIAAITKQFIERRIGCNEQSKAWWPQLHTFSVGLKDAPDLAAAQTVADHINSVHHCVTYTEQEGIDVLYDVIYHLETYDVTTIRASVPMYLMARKIRAMGIKMVLSGEGSDELFGGYLYFHKAPNAREFHEETVRKLDKLHMYDCLRANKSMMAWSIEARVPFLDYNFIDTAMHIDPQLKMITENKMEKYLLRKAFEPLLPESVVWRQKEQFSDGVGYSWIDRLQSFAETEIKDSVFAKAAIRFPYNTPQTKEAYLYRELFEQCFPNSSAIATVPSGKSVACSTPEALLWDKTLQQCIDPSGRAMANVHKSSYY